MKTVLGIFMMFSSSLIFTNGVLAHPHHPDSIHNHLAHSHSGIEYLLIFTVISIIGLILAINKFK